MFAVTKVLMVMWLIACLFAGACSVLVGGAAATAEPQTAEQVLAENPELTAEEAEQLAMSLEAGAAVGGTMLAGMGVMGTFMAWFVGMIPLFVMYLVFKPSGTTVQVQQIVGNAPAQQDFHRDS